MTNTQTPAQTVAGPDWSDSKTLPSEIWKNPLIPMNERLQIADGAVRFRDEVIENLRTQIASLSAQAQPVQSSPYGRWHHGNGVLCAGTIRVAREDFDTNPAEEVKIEIFDWMVKTLNSASDMDKAQPVQELSDLVESFPEINPSNYGHEEVSRLNNWGIEVVDTARALLTGKPK